MHKLLMILFCACSYEITFASTYYCDGTNCVLPSQGEQNGTFNSAKSTGNQYNSSGQSAPGFNYSSTGDGQNALAGQVGNSMMDLSKQGTQGSEQSFNNTKSDPNYLYNQGIAQIANCKSKTDPACQAVTRYNDDDTQRNLQGYDMGTNAFAYGQSVRADPNNSSCSIIRTYKPINPTDNMCMVGNHQQVSCEATLTPYREYITVPPNPADNTVMASGSQKVDACGGAWASSSSVIISLEALTNQGKVHLHMDNNSDAHCASDAPAAFDADIPFQGFNQTVYSVNQGSCGGGHWDMGGFVEVKSNGCSGDLCTYIVTVTATKGGDKHQCKDRKSATFYLNFNKPKAGYTDTKDHYPYNDQCASYR
jgi:hypothetical protein